MVDPAICSHCGARNPAEAEWCGQCFAHLEDETDPGLTPVAEPISALTEAEIKTAVPEAPTPTTEEPAIEVEPPTEGKRWVCTVCETPNALEDQNCSACGTSIFTAFGAEDEERSDADPQKALLRSALFPGFGHGYAGHGVLGSAIGGLMLMALGFGIAMAVTGAGRFGWPLILLAIAVWVVAAIDAVRIASGQAGTILLRPRVITALVGVVVIVVVFAAFSYQGRA